ncbi:MAG TPA: CorA family divalent cation transporter, partial [Methanocella sp.]|uniref:CorA family divalent cation transporter n=1 Tax=Methanocella sp. TaxID=2052833 RepID=UPI002C18FF0F
MSGLSDISTRAKSRLRGPASRLFSEDVMTVLAFLIIPVVGLPLVFSFSAAMQTILELINYFIIAMFVAEYCVMLYLSDSRVKYIRDPWHLLDLIIIVLALLDLAPMVSFAIGRASPALRLLRVFRVLTALGRTAKGRQPPGPEVKAAPTISRMVVKAIDKNGIKQCESDGMVCEIPRIDGPGWIALEDVWPIDLDMISKAIDIPGYVLESKIGQEAFPRIDYFKEYTAIFIWDARLAGAGDSYRDVRIERNGFLIVCKGELIVTICTGKSKIFDELINEGLAVDGEEFAVRTLYSICRRKVQDGENIVRVFERKAATLEQQPVGKTSPTFLEDTFHLRQDGVMVAKNLWHLRQVLDSLKTRKVALAGIKEEHLHLFDILYDQVDYLYETADNITDSLSSLRDLHINTQSYEMTRVMRILAIITCLALVP